ncbi:hypothetical protein AIN02nite_28630 [Acetobacter indonesiensis]|uniref:Uncharacterized protein n=1 Tax=Acetobacter indonesiensis TaxID=104101 RepID=A0A6N3T9L1_9PROT|nr:hypothetical protein Abin_003_014 [Acetobacter indonesiensis]GEN04838.1 hypothetical protein AIN02nite_28630 [Acetobacter indonesiensis]
MKHQEKETPKLVMLRASERTLLDRDEACKVLGIEPRASGASADRRDQ